MDYSNYSKEVLNALPWYELRIIGRNAGIKSPTTMKKEELIENILEACKSVNNEKHEIKVVQKSKKQGRPPKAGKVIIFNDSASDAEANSENQNETDEEEQEETAPNILNGITSGVDDVFGETEEKPKVKVYKKKPIQKTEKKQTADIKQNPENKQNVEKTNSQNIEEEPQDNIANSEEELELKEGVLEIMPDGYGFLRANNYESGEKDAYISVQKIKRCGLRKGDWVKAEAKKTCENRPAGVVNVLTVNGRDPETAFKRKNFDYLTPIYPDTRFKLEIEGEKNDFAIRSIDLVAPIGKGQRAMIVSPPKAGKTTLLKKVANSISVNYPDAHLMVLLIDERPEEVTDMQRSIKGEVIYSTFDEMPEHHTKAAELVLERAKRLVELGEDVVIVMDSLTRLARAYNLTIAPTGRTLSGGIDPGALHSPKRFFGAARNIENGGSLTIIATALIDTGSRMDDVIYEEFKGTGNMEIHLDRRLTEKRIFPAIDLNRSSTRKEELLLSQKELETVWNMRRMLNTGDGGDASEMMISELVKTKNNKEFIEQIDMKIKLMQKQGFWKN